MKDPASTAANLSPMPPRTLLKRDERRAQLLTAGAAAFVDAGFSATSIEDVAAAAGVTKVIVYRHFDGKSDLYRSILDQVTLALVEAAQSQAGREQLDGVSPSLRSLLTAARGHSDAFRLLILHAPRESEFAEYASLIRDAMVSAVEQLAADSPSRPLGQPEAWIIPTLVDSGIAAVLHWLDSGDPADDDQFLKRSSEALRSMATTLID